MKFALVDGQRREPAPGLAGACPGCGQEVLAKCGRLRVWHWSHKGKRSCDPWWEPETEWHRAWKDQFPVEWQEIPMRSANGELHIADVRTPLGLVIEFQHSAIRQEERISREQFYQNMIWVIDGSRLKYDRPRVDENLSRWRQSQEGVIQINPWPDFSLPKRWLDCEVPVLFDFDGLSRDADWDGERDHMPPSILREPEWWETRGAVPDPLLCLLPHRFRHQAVYMTIKRESLAEIAKHETSPFDWKIAYKKLEERYPRQELTPRRRAWRF